MRISIYGIRASTPDLKANGLAYTNTSDNPTSTDLVNALATIVIDNNGTANPVIGTVYHPQTLVPVLSAGPSVFEESINVSAERMTIRNGRFIISTCNGSGITGDVWARQKMEKMCIASAPMLLSSLGIHGSMVYYIAMFPASIVWRSRTLLQALSLLSMIFILMMAMAFLKPHMI